MTLPLVTASLSLGRNGQKAMISVVGMWMTSLFGDALSIIG
jgi:hypothetical protein